ncbi:hypothetical protein HF295_07605 [Hujiaoplasma nucleasis]|uniref:Uncharacterized protein n=1 Tax=Hujiaoplasma nucleasis TaxID=2725268 RepID=A0A7L6N580_9MOLU|nr:hypothetical protein [Hujiaoplasma nucleasis]QLY40721.1 hypothetical protein HF295_07605 [Hujiaoplasma nucleasis]
MKEIIIKKNKNQIDVQINETKICSVTLDDKVINGSDLYKSYSWNIDDEYKLSDSNESIEKEEHEKTNIDYLYENVCEFFSGLILRIQEEKELLPSENNQINADVKDRIEKIKIISEEILEEE